MSGWWPPWEGIGVDDRMRQIMLQGVRADLERLWDDLMATEGLALETAEGTVRDRVLAERLAREHSRQALRAQLLAHNLAE